MIKMNNKDFEKEMIETHNELTEKLDKDGFIKIALDLRSKSISLDNFVKRTRKSGFWCHVIRITYLEDKPILALVIFGRKDTVIEKYTQKEADDIITKFKNDTADEQKSSTGIC